MSNWRIPPCSRRHSGLSHTVLHSTLSWVDKLLSAHQVESSGTGALDEPFASPHPGSLKGVCPTCGSEPHSSQGPKGIILCPANRQPKRYHGGGGGRGGRGGSRGGRGSSRGGLGGRNGGQERDASSSARTAEEKSSEGEAYESSHPASTQLAQVYLCESFSEPGAVPGAVPEVPEVPGAADVAPLKEKNNKTLVDMHYRKPVAKGYEERIEEVCKMDCKVPIKEHFRQPGEECRGKHEERYAKRYAEGYWKRYPKLKESFFMTNNEEHVLKCFENSYVSRRERNAKQEKNLEIKKICG